MIKTLVVGACLAVASTAVSAATVINGSFEDIGTNTLNGGGWNHFSNIPGWTGNPNVEIQSNPTLGGIDAQDGQYYVELDTNQDGGISQDIFFSAGKYRLSFYYSPRVNDESTSTNDMFFAVSDALDNVSIQGAPNDDYPWGKWTEVTADFMVASDGTRTLSFFADGGSYYDNCGNCGALIDNVSISAVPLPASAFLLIAGIGGLGFARRAKR